MLYIYENNTIDYFNMNKEPIYSSKDESKIEFESYQYDTIRSLNTGVNCYKKEKDHSVDGLRYIIQHWQEIGKCPVL